MAKTTGHRLLYASAHRWLAHAVAGYRSLPTQSRSENTARPRQHSLSWFRGPWPFFFPDFNVLINGAPCLKRKVVWLMLATPSLLGSDSPGAHITSLIHSASNSSKSQSCVMTDGQLASRSCSQAASGAQDQIIDSWGFVDVGSHLWQVD
jgi:hypothetical protein